MRRPERRPADGQGIVTGPRRSREPKHPLDCHERALRLLAVRPRSRRELETRLRRAGFDESEVVDELRRLEAVGLVDDEAFARAFAEHQLSVRGAGRRAVVASLAAKGVDRRTIDRTLEGVGGNEEARALELARGRVRRLREVRPDLAHSRLTSFLLRRGYGPDVARRAASRALDVDASDA